jgi:hypothetical protein
MLGSQVCAITSIVNPTNKEERPGLPDSPVRAEKVRRPLSYAHYFIAVCAYFMASSACFISGLPRLPGQQLSRA